MEYEWCELFIFIIIFLRSVVRILTAHNYRRFSFSSNTIFNGSIMEHVIQSFFSPRPELKMASERSALSKQNAARLTFLQSIHLCIKNQFSTFWRDEIFSRLPVSRWRINSRAIDP